MLRHASLTRKHPAASARAFTLVELMIVVSIIALLAAISIPAFGMIRSKSIATRAVNDLKKVSETFHLMLMENPSMPDGVYNAGGIGGVPVGFETENLPKSIYAQPIGPNSVLSFDLRTGLAGPSEGVVVITNTAGTIDPGLMLKIDEMMDDGDLANGDVRQANPSQLLYITYRD
jgi:prepilin-type N-terminal cleavage/methylation domain-containing protein